MDLLYCIIYYYIIVCIVGLILDDYVLYYSMYCIIYYYIIVCGFNGLLYCIIFIVYYILLLYYSMYCIMLYFLFHYDIFISSSFDCTQF